MRKTAFTMVEMIIAITIIGIAFLSVPVILRITSQSIELAMESRGFYHGLAKMQIVRNMPWDEENVDDLTTADLYYVLETGQDTGTELECDDVNRTRPGHYPGFNRRKCDQDGVTTSTIGTDGNDYDDIDDFHNRGADTHPNGYSVDVNVSYVDYKGSTPIYDWPETAASTTSLKRIDVFVTSDLGVVELRYSYYAANIGRPKPVIKQNP